MSIFMALSVGAYSFASPDLPCYQVKRFEGTFHYGNDATGASLTREISGIIAFELEFQNPDPANVNLDHVRWSFKMRTFDESLSATGGLDNEEAIGFPLSDPMFLVWGGEWDVWGDIQESYTVSEWMHFFSAVASPNDIGSWNLQTNENFLPSEMSFYGGGEMVSGTPGDEFSVDITMSPYFEAPIEDADDSEEVEAPNDSGEVEAPDDSGEVKEPGDSANDGAGGSGGCFISSVINP